MLAWPGQGNSCCADFELEALALELSMNLMGPWGADDLDWVWLALGPAHRHPPLVGV